MEAKLPGLGAVVGVAVALGAIVGVGVTTVDGVADGGADEGAGFAVK